MTKDSEMFWGLIMEPNKRYSQTVKKHFRITMAAQDVSSVDAAFKAEPSQVLCSYEGRNYLMCTLIYPNIMQCPLDLHFKVGTEVSFATNGKGHIHLTGVTIDEEESIQEDQSTDEEEEVVVEKKSKKSKKKKQDSSPEVPAKKAKLTNGFASEEVEEEEDDPDFEADENEESEEEEGDVEEEEESIDYDIYGDSDDDSAVDEEEVEEEEGEDKSKEQKKPKRHKHKKPMPLDPKNTIKLPSGILYEDIRVGTGPEVKTGRFVTIYFEGRLEQNNKLFDHCIRGEGFKFRLGKRNVIQGLDDGVKGMKVGGIRQIVCPPSAGYGAKGSPPTIPPNATLVFTVTVKTAH